MRLTEQERQLLALLEAALNVSEYTDNVDALSRRSKVHRILEGLRDMCAISAGLYVCSNLRRGERLCENSLDSAEAEELLQRVFEVGRRFKIMNPSKMRSSYGKLMWMLQDGMSRSVEEALGISLWRPINMVATFLEDRGAEALLCDARILTATQNVSTVDNDGQPRPREEIEALLAEKRESMRQLLETYGVRRGGGGGGGGGGTPQQKRKDLAREAEKGDDESEVPDCGLDQQPVLTREEVEAVIASIDDANSYLAANVGPVECILDLLTENFHAATYEKGFSLALGNGGGVTGLVRGALGGGYYGRGFSGGVSGGFGARAKLSHDHRMQFTFVFQTFTLWKEIMSNMYKLWCLADEDLLSGGHGGRYQLLNTGQGLNRVQSSPRVAKEMHRILAKVQRQVGGSWVGLSVVHLGDRDVVSTRVAEIK